MSDHGCEEADTCVFAAGCPHLMSCRLVGDPELTALCRSMPTRRCPDVFEGQCPSGCARFESDDEAPWMTDDERAGAIDAAVVAILADTP